MLTFFRMSIISPKAQHILQKITFDAHGGTTYLQTNVAKFKELFHAEVGVIPKEILFDFEPSEFLTWDQVEYDLSPELKAQSKAPLYQKQNKGKL